MVAIRRLSVALALGVCVAGCSSWGPREKGTAIGAGVGAAGGAVLSHGGALGTATGAVVGGVVGNEIGRRQKE